MAALGKFSAGQLCFLSSRQAGSALSIGAAIAAGASSAALSRAQWFIPCRVGRVVEPLAAGNARRSFLSLLALPCRRAIWAGVSARRFESDQLGPLHRFANHFDLRRLPLWLRPLAALETSFLCK